MFNATVAPVSVAAAIQGFNRWAADRSAAPAPPAVEVPTRFEPTTQEAWEAAGFRLGADGVLADVESVYPDASPRDHLVAAFNFYQGQHAGFSRFAREAGFAAGLDGQLDRLPPSIPGRFALAFELGHSAGIADRRMRGECVDDYHQQLAAEAEELEREQDLEQLARESGGWDRLVGREME